MSQVWARRAAAAEDAVTARHLHSLWGLPATTLGVTGWPPTRRERSFATWHYWWQAHLIDLAVDAALREPTPKRRRRVVRLIRSHRLRNITGWTNSYYDDMAWLGIAVERAQRHLVVEHRSAIATLEDELFEAWAPESGGGIPWRKKDDFYNTPANGPAGILLARTGKLLRAQATADWIDENLRDPETGLVIDGIRVAGGAVEQVPAIYTYCQGVVLGLETELAVRVCEPRHHRRVHSLVEAIDTTLAESGVIPGAGGGDGGLFSGILARYLAMVATTLPVLDLDDERARRAAARIVTTSAEAAWENRLQIEGLPLFGADWSVQASLPAFGAGVATFSGGAVHASAVAERDLSVQLSGWMVMEAAHAVAAADAT